MAGEQSPFNHIVPLPLGVGEASFAQALQGLALLPLMLQTLEEQRREIHGLRAAFNERPAALVEDGWLDAKAAARYLALSPTTFDKYRYNSSPKLKGYRLDGKTLYKRSDLDAFVKLYELKSAGLA
jgi:hypothetical protein